MKKSILSLLLLILTAADLFSMEENRITILDFTTSGVSESEMLIFIDYIAAEIPEHSNYKLIDRRRREQVLNELSFSNTGCSDDECRLEIGRLLSANFIVVGSIGSISSNFFLNMQLVNVETGETVKSVSDKYQNIDELVNDGRTLMNNLLSTETTPRNYIVPQPAGSVSSPLAAATAPVLSEPFKRITSRKTIFSTLYIYDKKLYDSFTSKPLGEIIFRKIPDTEENLNLYNAYQQTHKTGKTFIWTGFGIMGAGILLEIIGIGSESETVIVAGAIGGLGLGLTAEIIGGSLLSSAHKKFGELVKIYNNSLF